MHWYSIGKRWGQSPFYVGSNPTQCPPIRDYGVQMSKDLTPKELEELTRQLNSLWDLAGPINKKELFDLDETPSTVPIDKKG